MGWDPGRPPTSINGGATVPNWMNSGGFGQLQVLSLQAVELDDKGKKKKLNPFLVGKTMKDLVGEIEDTKTEEEGTVYVLYVRNPDQVKKLLSLKNICQPDGSAIVVVPHPRLNKRRCVISCRESQEMSEAELLGWIKDQNVIEVKRIIATEQGKKVNTPTVILTLQGTVVPDYIKIGPLRIKTRIYVPNPTICYICYNYGHTKFRCKAEAICRNCSKVHNLDQECKQTPFCLHCAGKHGPTSKLCPKFAYEKEIMRLRFVKGVSFEEAVKQIKAGGGSYAAISKVQRRLETAQDPGQANQLKEKDELIAKLLDTIEKLNTRVEELEKKQQQKKDKKDKKRTNRKERAKAEESASEMETDSSTKQTTGGVPAQVGGASSKVSGNISMSNVQKIHKRHPTTEIQPPNLKKTPPNSMNNETDKMLCPTDNPLNPDMNILPFSMNSQLVNRPLNTQHGQYNSVHKQQ